MLSRISLAAVVAASLLLTVMLSFHIGCVGDDQVCVGEDCAAEQPPSPDAGNGAEIGDVSSEADLTGDVTVIEDRGLEEPEMEDLAADLSEVGGEDGALDLDLSNPEIFRLSAPSQVSLPFAVVGTSVPDGVLVLDEIGGERSSGEIEVLVDGPFSVGGELGPLGANETRSLIVTYTGTTGEPIIINGSVLVTVDDQEAEVGLSAVVGDAGIADATWTTDEYGAWTIVELPSAPFPHDSADWTDSSVLILVPSGLSDAVDVGVVLHFHGHNATVDYRIRQQFLGELHTLSGRNAVFIAPQGPVAYSSNNFGKLHEPGAGSRLVRDVFSVLYRDDFIVHPVVGDAVITSHSGGYQAAADVITVGGLSVISAQLYDSLYGRLEPFEQFASGGGALRSNYTSSTDDNNLSLATTLEGAGLTVGSALDDETIWSTDIVIGRTNGSHNNCMYQERAAARWLTTSNLAPRPNAPVELLATWIEDGQARVVWRMDRGEPTARFRVQGSVDGESWETLEDTNLAEATVEPMPYLRVVRVTSELGESDPSDVYGATGDDWLVVDGFDRVLDGSWSAATHPFASSLGNALGEGFSVASNEAVVEGVVDPNDYWGVLWMLGDESVRDLTFDEAERDIVEAIVEDGRLIVTGAEVGYATESGWFEDTLHASFVRDDAGSTEAGGYEFGIAYEEDYPDVLSGETTLWSYDAGGAAAVIWNEQVIVVGFPLETVSDGDRAAAVRELVDALRPED